MSKRGRTGFLGRNRLQGPADPRGRLTAIPATMLTWDLATDTLTWGPNAAEVLGVPHIGLFPTGAAFADAVEPGSGTTRPEAVREGEPAEDGTGVPYRARYAVRIKADRLILVEETGRWFADGSGRLAWGTAVLRVDAEASREESLFSAGLKSRAALLSRIMDDVVEAQRSRHALTLVVGTCVPADGGPDEAMAEIVRRVRPLMRRRDRFAVYGPNRFALALASCPRAEAPAAVARVFSLIEGRDPGASSLPVRLGAASAPDHALDAPELLRRAEEALDRAEDGGGPGFVLYDRTLFRPASPAVGTTGMDVVEALNGRRLAVVHLPVVEARTRAILFHHSGPRIVLPDGSLSPASDVAAAAERDGFSLLLDGRLLETVADRLAAQVFERAALRIAPATAMDGEWLVMLAAHLGSRPDIESRLIVDIPEAALVEPSIRGRLDAMKALGVATMLSGFGTGHAGSKHLRSLPVDMVRIDGALIHALPSSIEIRHHVRSFVDLAHHLGIVAVADAVDDEATARLLAGWGVDCLQGAVAGPAVLADRPADRDARRTGTA
jgi:EAL domain-containing protein (putative c-di-GMP-specific phosphodiesterase class I)